MKTKTLPCIRIDSLTDSNIQQALKKLDKDSIVPVTLADFRRLAYLFTARKILLGENIKLQMQ